MQYVSFTEQIRRDAKREGRMEGRVEGREEWRNATLALAARFAAPILSDLQKIEDPEEMSRRLTEYMDKARG